MSWPVLSLDSLDYSLVDVPALSTRLQLHRTAPQQKRGGDSIVTRKLIKEHDTSTRRWGLVAQTAEDLGFGH